jgi:HSP20 family protein
MQQSMLRSSWPWADPWNDTSTLETSEVDWQNAFSNPQSIQLQQQQQQHQQQHQQHRHQQQRRDSFERSMLANTSHDPSSVTTSATGSNRRASLPAQLFSESSPSTSSSSLFISGGASVPQQQHSLLTAFPPTTPKQLHSIPVGQPPPSPQQQQQQLQKPSAVASDQYSIPLTHQQQQLTHDHYGQQTPLPSMQRREYHPVKRAPPVDMIDLGNKIQIVVELPGLKKENLKIDIHDKSHFLTLKGRYEREDYGEEASFLMNERTHGKFRRRIRLPQYADIDNVQANMKDGLLIVEMPSLKKQDIFKKKRVVSLDGLQHQTPQQQYHQQHSDSHYFFSGGGTTGSSHHHHHEVIGSRRFEWGKEQNDRPADTTVHHHHK